MFFQQCIHIKSSDVANQYVIVNLLLQEFNDEKEAVVSAFRRMLSYPIYRSWELCMAVFEDVKQVLKLGNTTQFYFDRCTSLWLFTSKRSITDIFSDAGKTSVIKRLCDIHSLFTDSSNDAPRYILNQLYIKDYLIWLQKVPSALIESLHESVNSVSCGDSILALPKSILYFS